MRTLIVTALIATVACRKSPEPVAATSTLAPVAPSADEEGPHDHDATIEKLVEHFQRVHFEFDSAKLTEGSMDALAANARILQRHPLLNVEIQGHADERGTSDYNLALGDKRARAVAGYLTAMGVRPKRIKVVSYGEERPSNSGNDEVAWSENRRCEFRIFESVPDVQGTVADL